jgi:hypothetical protein
MPGEAITYLRDGLKNAKRKPTGSSAILTIAAGYEYVTLNLSRSLDSVASGIYKAEFQGLYYRWRNKPALKRLYSGFGMTNILTTHASGYLPNRE